MNALVNVTCGGLVFNKMLPDIVTTIINIIKFGVPVILIVFGMLDLGKAVIAQKDDEIKKGQATFMKRFVAAIMVFLVIAIVQTVFGLFIKEENAMSCVGCFTNASTCKEYNEN